MDRNEIRERVLASADRFGAGNQQQFRLLGSLLSKCQPAETSAALLSVFTDLPRDDKHFQRQELAGRLLEKMKPLTSFDLEATARAALPNYNPSIEQLPYHFVRVHGLQAVLDTLEKIALTAEARELSCIKTMQWWLAKAPAQQVVQPEVSASGRSSG